MAAATIGGMPAATSFLAWAFTALLSTLYF